MNYLPTEESVRDKLTRGGALFASDEVRLLTERLKEVSSETQRLRGVLFSGIEIASRYMDTGRGDLDGWLELADRTLNELSGCDHE